MVAAVVKMKYDKLGLMMDERLKRHWAACEALALGYGGVSAVAAIEQPQYVSRSATINESSSLPWPNLNPHRAPRMTCGAWLIDSIPPARTTFASPSWINCAAEMIDCMPDPHKRFTVRAGISTGSPALSATCRAP